MILATWIHNLDPFFIKFPDTWFIEGIRWYGVMYLLSFILASVLLFFYSKRGKISWDWDMQSTFISAMIIGLLLGGRGGYMLLYNLENFLANPLSFFYISHGGMASHGAMIGIMVAILWFCRHYKASIWETGDVVVTIAPLGIMLGRIGNFINGELWGKVTDVSWGMIFPLSAPAWIPLSMIPARHPVQLYSAALEGLLLFVYMQWRYWRGGVQKGQLVGEFLIGYSIVRIIDEFFREPDASLILGLSRGVFYTIFLLIAGIGVICFLRKKS